MKIGDKFLITLDFKKALRHAEASAFLDNDKWCVVKRYSAYNAMSLSYAEGRGFSICTITIY